MSAVEQLITEHLDIWSSAVNIKSTTGRGNGGKLELYGIKKLRALILELAVRGLLMPQDPNDEPASELLKKIAAEKARLVKEGKIKKEKPLPPVNEDEVPFELPKGWEWTRIGIIAQYGRSEKVNSNEEVLTKTWVLDLEDIEKETSKLIKKVISENRPFNSSKTQFKKGDVLFGKLRPYLNKVIVADEDGVCTTEIIPISNFGKINSDYIKLILKSPLTMIKVEELMYGMKMPRLGTDDAINLLVTLPPLPEQHRIVAKVDEIMAICDSLKERIKSAQCTQSKFADALVHHQLN